MLSSGVASQTRKIARQIRDFARRISPDLEVRTDAFLALLVLGEWHRHDDKTISLEKVDDWLPKVHVISNIKSFLAGTFQGVSHRFFQEPRLLNRLLQAAVEYVPIRAFLTYS